MLGTIIKMDKLMLPDFFTESCVSQEKFLVQILMSGSSTLSDHLSVDGTLLFLDVLFYRASTIEQKFNFQVPFSCRLISSLVCHTLTYLNYKIKQIIHHWEYLLDNYKSSKVKTSLSGIEQKEF